MDGTRPQLIADSHEGCGCRTIRDSRNDRRKGLADDILRRFGPGLPRPGAEAVPCPFAI